MKCNHVFYLNDVKPEMAHKIHNAVYSDNNKCTNCNISILDIPVSEIKETHPSLGIVFDIYSSRLIICLSLVRAQLGPI